MLLIFLTYRDFNLFYCLIRLKNYRKWFCSLSKFYVCNSDNFIEEKLNKDLTKYVEKVEFLFKGKSVLICEVLELARTVKVCALYFRTTKINDLKKVIYVVS